MTSEQLGKFVLQFGHAFSGMEIVPFCDVIIEGSGAAIRPCLFRHGDDIDEPFSNGKQYPLQFGHAFSGMEIRTILRCNHRR